MPEPRYAIYFVPAADTELYRFGAAVLGYDCYSGRETALIDGVEIRSWKGLVRDPRVYGFHATLKPPFHLTKGFDEADIDDAVLRFASNQPAIPVGKLAVRELGSFVALVPESRRPRLDGLARSCVREFDRFRMAMTEQERVRRLTPGLTDRQIENLYRWGYPYVFEDFRFHMTLTGSLSLAKRTKALRFLCEKFEQMPASASLIIDQIVIARQSAKGSPFQVTRVVPLARSPHYQPPH